MGFTRRFVVVQLPDITLSPAFTQHSTYGFYPVGCLLTRHLSSQATILSCVLKYYLDMSDFEALQKPDAGCVSSYEGLARRAIIEKLPSIFSFSNKQASMLMQASAISKLGAEVKKHNTLLPELAKTFPSNHPGSRVYVYDFGAALSQVRSLPQRAPA
jgi:hypothetical protein